jgi:hypothetical protein
MAKLEPEDYLKELSEEQKQKLFGLLSGARPKTDSKGATAGEVFEGHSTKIKMPKLRNFSGSQTSKSEPSFRVWRFEVENLKQNFKEHEVKSAIHQSVTGMAAEILMRLGQDTNVTQILDKFQNIFGTVISDEKLLSDFYTSKQNSTETVAEWACRIEDMLCHPNLVGLPNRNKMLKSRFFHGLSSEAIRNAIRHRFEEENFDRLLVLAREAEDEITTKTGKAVSKPQVVDPMMKQLEEIQKSLKTLTTRTEDWEKRLSRVEQQRKKTFQQKKPNSQESSTIQHSDQKQELICFYCKTPGHMKRNCKKYLNSKQSASRGDK